MIRHSRLTAVMALAALAVLWLVVGSRPRTDRATVRTAPVATEDGATSAKASTAVDGATTAATTAAKRAGTEPATALSPSERAALTAVPAGRFRSDLERLAAPARSKALAKLARLHPPREDYASLHLSPDGGIYYACTVPAELRAAAAAANAATAAGATPTTSAASVTLANVPVRHSKSGARYTVYLDFGGGVITGTAWNTSESVTSYTAQAYDTDGDATTFSDTEQAVILDVWARVAEDYAPFDVDVTTEKPSAYTARTVHAMITKSTDADGTTKMPAYQSGGVAYVGIFDSGGFGPVTASQVAMYSPAFIYADNIVATRADHIAEATAHEIGHNFGLSHDGVTTTAGDNYYFGHGANTATSWAPIMGGGYDKNFTQWSKGDYYLANNTEDDVAIIAGVSGYRTDEAGGTIGTATTLTATAGAISTTGVLSQSSDVDVYAFTTGAGSVSFTATGYADATNTHGGDAWFTVELLDGSGNVLTSGGSGGSTGTVSAILAAGTYYVRLTPAGTGSPLSSTPTGFTSYASIGQYTLTGTVSTALTDQTITFTAPTGHTYGDAPFTLSATASSGLTVTFAVVSGPATVTGSTLTITGAGDVTVRASQAGNSAYNAAPTVDRTFTVAKAALTATADDQTRNFGEANPALTIHYAGFVNGEDASVLASAPTAATTADLASAAGTYPITLSGGAAANYTLTLVDGTLTVLPVNQAPTIGAVADQTILEDGTTGALEFAVGDDLTAAASLTVTAVSSNQALVPDAAILLGGSGADRTVAVTPAANANGTTTITLTVSDGSLSTSTSFMVTVTAVNDAPSIGVIADQTTAEDTPTAALPFTVGDVETAAAALTVTAHSSDQSLIPDAAIVLGGSGANRTVAVTPAANANGAATITLTVSDGELTASTSFLVTVTAVNDAPTISAIDDQTIAEDTATTALAFTVGDVETDAAALTVTATSSNQVLVPDAAIVIDGEGADRTVTVTPRVLSAGSATITLTVSDGDLTTSTSFTLTVTPVAQTPTISAVDDQTIAEDGTTGALAVTLADADTDVAALTLTATSSNQTLVPDAAIAIAGEGADRTVTVTPAANASGTATITLTVSDGGLNSSTTFAVTVTPVNDAPTISTVDDQTMLAGTVSAALSFTVDDVETAAAALVVTAGSSNQTLVPDAGLQLAGEGADRTVTITPAPDESGTATITLTVSDGTTSTSTSFVVTVTRPNTAPTIGAIAAQRINVNTATAALPFAVGDAETDAAALTVTARSSNTTLVPE